MLRALRSWQLRRRRAGRFALLERLLSAQSITAAELADRQRRDFDAMARYAAANTDYYARRFAASLPDADLRVEPSALPILDRQDVIDNLSAMLVRDADPATTRLGYTGGSTGRPMAFYYNEAKHELMLAGMMRGFMMSGWRPGDKVLYLWGASRDTMRGGVFGHAGSGLLDTEKTVAAFELSEIRLREWADTIRNWRPTLLYGYASVLGELARYVIDERIRLPRSLLGVYATAEVLHDWQRDLMQRAFGCRAYNQYGCREVPNIAWECRAGGMHVFSDMVHLEAEPIDGERHLVVSSLSDRLMPFIRYDTGDIGHLIEGECACGSPFPTMHMSLCRHNDLIRTPNGRQLHPAYFNQLLYGMTQVHRYQWVQTSPSCLQLNLVGRQIAEADIQAIRAALRRDIDPAMSLVVRYLDEIPRTAAGKHRFVIGLCAESFGACP